MRTFTKEYREKHRNTFLKMYNPPDELWMFYMGADTIVISNKGRVKNLATGKIFKCHPNQQGYIMTNIKFGNGTRRSCMVHRLVAETFIP